MAAGSERQSVEDFDQSDVTRWGIVALVACATAVLSANLIAAVPQGLLTGLHASRAEGGSLNLLRSEVAALRSEANRIRAQNSELSDRLMMSENAGDEVVRRVGALESSIPSLLEVIPAGTRIDPTATGAITPADGQTYDVPGGSVSVTHRALFPGAVDGETGATPTQVDSQPMPAKPEPSAPVDLWDAPFAVALGTPVGNDNEALRWNELSRKLGPLLLGLRPLLSDVTGNGDNRIVAGPISDYAEAEQLCARMNKVGVDCLPVKYHGQPLSTQ